MEKKINRRNTLKYVATAAAATTLGVATTSASQYDQKDLKLEGGWLYKDEGYEKHIPVVTVKRDGEIAKITVEVKHPQGKSHHISTFKLYDVERIELVESNLHPEKSVPKTEFYLEIEEGTDLIATSDCNLHGIWMKRFQA